MMETAALISKAITSGDLKGARKLVSNYLEDYSVDADIEHLSGVIYQNEMDYEKAKTCFLNAAKYENTPVVLRLNLLKTHVALKELQDAAEVAREIAESDNRALLYAAGDYLMVVRQYEIAETFFRIAIKKHPFDNKLKSKLLQTLRRSTQVAKALELLSDKEFVTRIDSDVLFELAVTLMEVRQDRLAEDMYKKALEIDPNHSAALTGLAVILIQNGENEGGINLLERAMEIDENDTRPYLLLTNNSKYKPKKEHEDQLMKLYCSPDLPVSNRIEATFALFNLFHRKNDHKAAFKYLIEANHLVDERLDYDIDEDLENLRFRKQFAESIEYVKEKSACPIPIFIVGLPRSGTTLLEKIITNHSEVASGEELMLLPNMLARHFVMEGGEVKGSSKLMRDEYFAKLKMLLPGGEEYICDKMPFNFNNLFLIKKILPESKILVIERNRYDVLFSNFSILYAGAALPFSYNVDKLLKYCKNYDAVIAEFRDKYPDTPIIKYESLVSDPDAHIRQIINYLGLKWEEGCLSPEKNSSSIRTASATQIRSGINKQGIDRWAVYKDLMQEHAGHMMNE